MLERHYKQMRSYPWAQIVIEVHLIPAFGRMPLAKITTKSVIDYMAKCREKGLGPATINGHRAVLSKVLSLAVDWDLIPQGTSPLRKAKKLEVLSTRERWLTPEEQRSLLAAGDTNRLRHARDAAMLSLATGGRHEEVLLLRWQDIDLTRGAVTFRAETTKNGKARTVPLASAPARAMLEARQAARSEQERFKPNVFTYRGRCQQDA